jgi:hypothetical protein
MTPQFDLLVELIRDVARTQPLRQDLTLERAARLIHYTVLAEAHSRALGSDGASEVPAETIWQFCLSGLGFSAGSSPAKSRRSGTRAAFRSGADFSESSPRRAR